MDKPIAFYDKGDRRIFDADHPDSRYATSITVLGRIVSSTRDINHATLFSEQAHNAVLSYYAWREHKMDEEEIYEQEPRRGFR